MSPAELIKRQMMEEQLAAERGGGSPIKIRWEQFFNEVAEVRKMYKIEDPIQVAEETAANEKKQEEQAKEEEKEKEKKPKSKIQTVTDARLNKEKRRKQQLEVMFPDRIDKSLMRGIYTEDKESINKVCAHDKYQIKLNQLSPFVDAVVVHQKVAV